MGDFLEKRKGVALITVIVLFAFTSILAVAILSVYRNSVMQNMAQKNASVVQYEMYSGLNIIESYIINTNEEFLKDYNSFLSSHDRDDEYIIDLSGSGVPVSVSITSKKTPENGDETNIENTEVVYNIVSSSNDPSEKKYFSSEVKQIDIDGVSEFEVGTVK